MGEIGLNLEHFIVYMGNLRQEDTFLCVFYIGIIVSLGQNIFYGGTRGEW